MQRQYNSVKLHQIPPFSQIPPDSTIQSKIPPGSTIQSIFRDSTRFHYSVDSTKIYHFHQIPPFSQKIPPGSTIQSIFRDSTRFHYSVDSTKIYHFYQIPPFSQKLHKIPPFSLIPPFSRTPRMVAPAIINFEGNFARKYFVNF